MSVTTLTKRLVATAQQGARLRAQGHAGARPPAPGQTSGRKARVVTWEHGKRRTPGSAGRLTLDEAREIARKIIAEHIRTALHFRHA